MAVGQYDMRHTISLRSQPGCILFDCFPLKKTYLLL